MRSNFALSYRLLSWPIPLIGVLLYFFQIGVLHLGRRVFEGVDYNTSLASEYGDLALIVSVLLAARIVQRGIGSTFLTCNPFHIGILVLCVAAGFIAHKVSKSTQVMDIYHDFFILPSLVYLMLTIGPLTLVFGYKWEKWALLILVLFWALMLFVDVQTGRLNQRQWLRQNLPTIAKKLGTG